MKKTILFLGCIALFVASCNKIETVEEPVQDSPRHLKVNIKVNNAETRAVKTKWAAGDKIYVTFDVCFPAELDSVSWLPADRSLIDGLKAGSVDQ